MIFVRFWLIPALFAVCPGPLFVFSFDRCHLPDSLTSATIVDEKRYNVSLLLGLMSLFELRGVEFLLISLGLLLDVV